MNDELKKWAEAFDKSSLELAPQQVAGGEIPVFVEDDVEEFESAETCPWLRVDRR